MADYEKILSVTPEIFKEHKPEVKDETAAKITETADAAICISSVVMNVAAFVASTLKK